MVDCKMASYWRPENQSSFKDCVLSLEITQEHITLPRTARGET